VSYSQEVTAEAVEHPHLGAEYFHAREFASGFMKHWQEEYATELANDVIKPVLDGLYDKVLTAFQDHLFSDVEQNIQTEMRRMVEDSVKAVIGGKRWANVKYISIEGYETTKVRETLAKLYSDEIKDGRITDLEKEVARLSEQLRLHTER